jgi:ubiquinone/menaquinone biosynthesis C-methylase UbiE
MTIKFSPIMKRKFYESAASGIRSTSEQKMVNVFFEVHSGLPREGPGDNESTKKAYSMLNNLPENPRILDIGCGPGMQTITLAKLSNGRIEAVDNHQPFLEQLKKNAKEEDVSEKITAVNRDMTALDYEDGTFDVVWCEGAIFIIGFERGLREWKRLLTDNGYLVVSEMSWLTPNPPEEVKNFLMEAYPAIKTINENLETIKKAGYRVISHFVLPKESWWDNYYTPIEAKLTSLKRKYKDDKEALEHVAAEELEIEMFRKYSDYYGYVFYVMQA